MRRRVLTAGCVFLVIIFASGCLGTPSTEQPSADHSLYLENLGSERTTIEITVLRNTTNEVVHNQSYVLDPGERRAVYNTNESTTDGIEPFEIRWATGNKTGTVRIKTNRCFGNAYVRIQEDGTATDTYTVC